MTRKELVQKFFIEGYDKQNYDFVLNSLAPDYVDHSPAGARGARAAADILKAVAGMFGELKVEVLDLFAVGSWRISTSEKAWLQFDLSAKKSSISRAQRAFSALDTFAKP